VTGVRNDGDRSEPAVWGALSERLLSDRES